MRQFSFLSSLYNDLLVIGCLIPDEFSHEVFAKLAECQGELCFLKKAVRQNDKRIFEAVYIKFASDYNYESGFYFKKNYDLGEGWTAFLDAYRDGKVKSIQEWVAKRRRAKKPKKKKSSLAPIDSYCESDKNADYWEELLDTEDNKSVRDFIKYVKEIKC